MGVDGLAVESSYQAILDLIENGKLLPGHKINEMEFAEELEVSRNTLREAFRLLRQHDLVVHKPYKGVYVKHFQEQEVEELYEFRRIVQVAALRAADVESQKSKVVVDQLEKIIAQAKVEVTKKQWFQVAILNGRFHQGLFDLADNPRLSRLGEEILIQMRLIFLGYGSPEFIHVPFVERNEGILKTLKTKGTAEAAHALDYYLDQSLIALRQSVDNRA